MGPSAPSPESRFPPPKWDKWGLKEMLCDLSRAEGLTAAAAHWAQLARPPSGPTSGPGSGLPGEGLDCTWLQPIGQRIELQAGSSGLARPGGSEGQPGPPPPGSPPTYLGWAARPPQCRASPGVGAAKWEASGEERSLSPGCPQAQRGGGQ
ncbi:hypothetical protein H1C71_012030 [Ictidomys tridecemlineatus]|nr:hypothetical protein H1C71_012030 [Ictidomys tridecemlineatus]